MVKPRDADNTRQLLLSAARNRFARDGYSSTTVRDIASDAGVNVALINRYFTSKEGLFEACIERVGEELGRPERPATSIPDVAAALVKQIVGYSLGEDALQLRLLVRTSGDERVDQIRRTILESFGERLAGVAGWKPGELGSERTLLGAQIVLSTAIGIVQLRAVDGLEPLSSAAEEQLIGPLTEVLNVLLKR